MDKELMELFESAKKAADAAADDGVKSGGSEETRCVDALKQLKKVPVTMQVLVQTQVGKRLRHLTKHPRERIQAVASDLLELWKRIVLEETGKNKKNGIVEEVTSPRSVDDAKSESHKIEKMQRVNSVKVEKVSRAETIKVEKTDHRGMVKSEKISSSETVKIEKAESVKIGGVEPVKVEKIAKEEKQVSGIKRPLEAPAGPPKLTSMIKCNDATRDKIRELLADAFSRVHNEANEDLINKVNASDPIRVAVCVESVLLDKLGRSTGSQKLKYRSIMFNLKDAKNPDLRRRVLIGEIKPERLINMTPEEMASDERKRDNDKIKEKALFECERAAAPKATTDQFKCGRCGQRKCTYYQLQTRSADEPMTTFVTCVNCNNHWKFC